MEALTAHRHGRHGIEDQSGYTASASLIVLYIANVRVRYKSDVNAVQDSSLAA